MRIGSITAAVGMIATTLAVVAPATQRGRGDVAPTAGEPFFVRTVEVQGNNVADTAWNMPDIPEGTRHLDIIIDVEGDPQIISGSPSVTRVTGAFVEAELPNGARVPMSVGRVTSLSDELGIPQAVVATARGSVLPPESPNPVLSLDWDTVALTLFGGGTITPDEGYEWTITVEVVPVFDV